MKKGLKIILLALVGQLSVSCLNLNNDKEEKLSLDSDFETVEINDKYSMRIPNYMKKADNLNMDASLQYQNIYKETYIIVIDENKEEFISVFKDIGEYSDSLSPLKNYKDAQLQFIGESINIGSMSEDKAIKINRLDAEKVIIDGTVEGVDYDISYFLTFIEGKETFYMIMAWTLQDKKNKYRPTFEASVKSFREL